MEYEDYLIEEKSAIIAISSLSLILKNLICENYSNLDNNKPLKEEILAMITAIQAVAFCMRLRRKEFYQEIEEKYQDDFSYDSVIISGI